MVHERQERFKYGRSRACQAIQNGTAIPDSSAFNLNPRSGIF
jgi:hypothetical protein